MIEAKIIKDSIGAGTRLTTFVLTYPRFIHAEFMTHRMFSRNASSSRAIPVKKQISMVLKNPAMPLAFAANKSGMQAGATFGPLKQLLCRTVWRGACYAAVFFATLMEKLNIHKQYANRILEPFSHITVVCTATDFANFFALRVHKDAQPEIHELARQMYDLYSLNKPEELNEGEWHLPFITDEDAKETVDWSQINKNKTSALGGQLLIKRSVAKCARVSYLNHDGKRSTVEQDLELYYRLVGSAPIHASPAEHQAVSSFLSMRSGNFGEGWVQYRKTLANENIEKFAGPDGN